MAKKKSNPDRAQYPDQPNLKQIETKRRERPEPIETEAAKSRRARGWEPQSEATPVTPVDDSSA